MADTDILGTAQTPMEQEALRAYDLLKQLAVREVMPLFWPDLAYRAGMQFRTLTPCGIPGWDDGFYGWTRIEPGEVGLDLVTFARWRSEHNR